MPNPSDYETEKAWMSACVPVRKKEGDEQDQAVAVCLSMWRKHTGQPEPKGVGKKKESAMVEELKEAITKKMGPRNHPAGDFLVVEDPKKPTTWHLPVKINGKPNRKLAGQAWAALYAPEGFRGQPYDGPDKAGAKSKLKALYKSQGWEEPTRETYAELGILDLFAPPPTSFEDLLVDERAQRLTRIVCRRTSQLSYLLENIARDPAEDDKLDRMSAVCAEFLDLVRQAIEEPEEEEEPVEAAEPEQETTETEAAEADPVEDVEVAEAIAESMGGALSLFEEVAGEQDPARAPIKVDFALIRPGWGNPKDAHYYPREMLERDAHVFEGVKMYATDHRPAEKSVRTEVAVIEKVVGFTDDGAPIGRAAIFDPDFAEATRNRAAAGHLGTLECSILATGRARRGEVDGRKGKIVEGIESAESVDLVTRAGAGGQALNIAEAAATDAENLTAAPETVTAAPEATLRLDSGQATAPVIVQEAAPARPDRARVLEILNEARLPAHAVTALALGGYETEQAAIDAAAEMRRAIAEAAGAGRPFGQGAGTAPAGEPETFEELDRRGKERFGRIAREVGLRVGG